MNIKACLLGSAQENNSETKEHALEYLITNKKLKFFELIN
jgi:hypothetical protein